MSYKISHFCSKLPVLQLLDCKKPVNVITTLYNMLAYVVAKVWGLGQGPSCKPIFSRGILI